MSAPIRTWQQFCRGLSSVAIVLAFSASARASEHAPTYVGTHITTQEDRQAILDVLSTYTRAVNAGDEALFESQLLDQQIRFFGFGGTLSPSFEPRLASVQDYASFKRGFPKSGQGVNQRFYNIHIEQDGNLAHASLNFENAPVGDSGGAEGWKTIQLLKVAGHWKIVSEFYTVYDTKALK
ncbi:nuclear transport factor 2 family protein [Sphingomonas sp. TREG-RG-20F-R18-01]|uniref:YybH family protein n=1 Tax=Sphingomonas sp. TREG-RG-20F-R18-01 TaxID=2914982 RepID=UPI001F588AC9|nr:nuclear transport factor 2 family protein [Sphingomonas sp. TREG-RG-20F-R18-01]